MKLKKFRVRYCISPMREELTTEVVCSDEIAAKNIVTNMASQGNSKQMHVSIHEIVEIAG